MKSILMIILSVFLSLFSYGLPEKIAEDIGSVILITIPAVTPETDQTDGSGKVTETVEGYENGTSTGAFPVADGTTSGSGNGTTGGASSGSGNRTSGGTPSGSGRASSGTSSGSGDAGGSNMAPGNGGTYEAPIEVPIDEPDPIAPDDAEIRPEQEPAPEQESFPDSYDPYEGEPFTGF